MSAISAAERTNLYDIPLGHLEYSYIGKCKDVKELEKIIKVLRSGDEGKYPELEAFAEEHLESLNPRSRVLRKDKPVSTLRDLGKSEWEEITGDLDNWTSEMKSAEETLKGESASVEMGDGDLPPVRGQSNTILVGNKSKETEKVQSVEPSNKKQKNKRVKPRDYREWDKFDIDAELAKVKDVSEETPQEEEKPKKPTTSNVLRKSSKPAIPDQIDGSELSEQEKSSKATAEKEKGNEAFRAGDFEEAVLYYSRSLSLVSTVAAYNNRAQAYLKLKDWDKALSDCQTVLEREPGNLKGVLRRAVAYKGKLQYVNAKNDLQKVLSADPANKRAQDILDEVEKLLEEQKVKGRRMVIEESDGSDSEEESDTKTNDNNQIPETVETLVNGVNEPKEGSVKEPVKAETNKSQPVNTEIDKSQGQNTQNIWDEEDLKSTEQKSEPTKNLTEACQKAQESKPSTESINKKIESATSENNTKSSANENTSGKAGKRKKKGKGSAKQQINENKEKTKDQNVALQNTEDQNVKSQAAEVPGQPAANVEVPDSTSSSTTKAAPIENEKPSEPLVREPPPQKPLPASVVKLKTTGNDLFKVGQYGEAIQHYDKGINFLISDKVGHEANLAVLYSNRAACKLKVGDCEGCVRDCDSSLELQPGGIKPLTRRAQAYETMERYRKAYMDFRQVLYIDSSVDVAIQGVNRCMKALQQVDGPKWREKLPKVSMSGLTSASPSPSVTPVSTPNDAPSTHPPSAETTNSQPKAEPEPTLSKQEVFEKHKAEGNALVQKGEYVKAVSCYTKCITTLPDQSAPYTNRALCNLRLNKAEEVIGDCDKALELEPENIKALFRRAQAYKMLEKYDESFHDLTCLLKKDPKNSSARREFQVVINYREQAKKARLAKEKEEKENSKKQKTAATNQRKKIQIQEISDSSESEDDEPIKAKTVSTDKPKPSSPSPKHQSPAMKKSQKKGQSPKAEPEKGKAKPETSEAKTTKHDAKQEKPVKKSEPETDSSEKKPLKSEASKKSPSESEKSTSATEDKTKSHSKENTSAPKLVNKTPYEFVQAWTALRLVKQTEPYAELLEQIEPEELPKVISNKLDGDMLHMIIKCVELLLDKGSSEGAAAPSLFSRSLAYLQELTKVPRFSMVTMFMGKKEKQDFERVLQKLNAGATCQYLKEDLGKLRKAYDL